MSQPRLFDVPKVSRPRRVLMHVIDAGPDDQFEDGPGVTDNVRFGCKRCGHETDWERRLRSEAKRGEPCPVCNADGVEHSEFPAGGTERLQPGGTTAE